MKLNLKKIEDNKIELTNNSIVFADTELANSEFSVTIQKLNRADKIDVAQNSFDGEDTIKMGLYSKNLFMTSIVNAQGFTNEDGAELEFNEDLKEVIWEIAPDELINAIKDITDGFNKSDEEKKSDTEILTQNMQDGTQKEEYPV
jgi:hypothetical protein